MESDSEFVVLTEQSSAMHAQWIAGALEAEGIKTFVDEDNLADEFAVSQKLLGMPRIRVMVLRGELTEARTIFLKLSQPIPLVDEDDEDEDDDEELEESWLAGPLPLLLIIVGVIAVAGIAYLLKGCEAEDEGPPRPAPRSPLHR